MLSWMRDNVKKTKTVATVLFVATVFVFSAFVITPEISYAQEDRFGVQEFEQTTVLTSTDIRVVIARIINAVLGLLGIITLGVVLYGGFVIMTAGGNEQRVELGKKVLINGTIGLAIILSAFAITRFVINSLSKATGVEGPRVRPDQVRIDSFEGSAGLGHLIRDHYPMRDETNVSRSTRIAITFRDPILPASIIQNTNGDDIVGNCVEVPEGEIFDWAVHCDQLKTESITIYQSELGPLAALQPDQKISAAAIASYDSEGDVRTFIIRPLETFGGDAPDVDPQLYTVQLTDQITFGDGTSIFERHIPYFWEFETGNSVDTDPPRVLNMIPNSGDTVPRNQIIQINFDEAISPDSFAESVTPDDGYTRVVFHKREITGSWIPSNGYRTFEFIPDNECGVNSCGETIRCLDIACDDPFDQNCFEQYQILVRTGELQAANAWEAIPQPTGVIDTSGNAMDGDGDGIRDGRPGIIGDFDADDLKTINEGEVVDDNFVVAEDEGGPAWQFRVQNTVDRTAPHIMRIEPTVDKENVHERAELTITFSKAMQASTLDSIQIYEHPRPDDLPLMSKAVRSELRRADDGSYFTHVNVIHREFGPDGNALYYYPEVKSTVRSLNQNCFYPGLGPEAVAGASSCDGVAGEGGCIDVSRDSEADTGCASGENLIDAVVADTNVCRALMEDHSFAVE